MVGSSQEIARLKGISLTEAVERVLNNQSRKELYLVKEVNTTIRNIIDKEKQGYYDKK